MIIFILSNGIKRQKYVIISTMIIFILFNGIKNLKKYYEKTSPVSNTTTVNSTEFKCNNVYIYIFYIVFVAYLYYTYICSQ